MDKQRKVAVLYGGQSAEREVSLRSGQAVLQALQQAGIEAAGFDTEPEQLELLHKKGFDLAFIALHGRGGEDGVIQAHLESIGVAYTGSGVAASALGMDKIRTKQAWLAAGLPTPASHWLQAEDELDLAQASQLLAELGGTLMVKPSCEGSSIGMSRVSDAESLVRAVLEARKFDGRILLEQWIDGAEYTVALVGEQILPSVRLKTPHEFYDYQAKYQSQHTQYLCPSDLSVEQEQQIGLLAQQAFQHLGCQGWGRVDLMRDAQDRFWLLEVNTAPGMTEKSLVPMAAAAQGWSFAQLVQKILELAVVRG